MQSDVIIIGAGLAGIVAACEAANKGRKVLLLDQEGPQSLGGQAFWSLGGLFMIDTPEQRRMKINDSPELALSDWLGSAQFDRVEDKNPKRVAKAYLEFASGEMRSWLYSIGMRWFPVVGWAERGGAMSHQHGNSVPRFHITWGTGPGVLAPFLRILDEHINSGRINVLYRHKATTLLTQNGSACGIAGQILENDTSDRGISSNRKKLNDFEYYANAIVLTTGGIGGDHDKVRALWPQDRLGTAPKSMLSGVPDYVDGQMQQAAEQAGAQIINLDRMWHYTEGLKNWNPIWPNHGIRILPGPSSIWLDANGDRMPAPFMPGFDTLGTLRRILSTGHDHSWFVTTPQIIAKEFALSGSEQNPDISSGKWSRLLKERILARGAPKPVQAFVEHGTDFLSASSIDELAIKMNKLTPHAPIDNAHIHTQIKARDSQIDNPFSKDTQINAIRSARAYLGDRLIRTAKPHRILDPQNGPLIAVRLNILTRKSLGGLHTDVNAQVLKPDGSHFDGLFAAGEIAGFGGGGYHGYNALEGTFLGGCIFSGRAAGRAV